jgi:predicted ATP-dependent serine protease
MPGINVMLTGDPGVGKSSNLMEILVNVKKHDPTKRVLYISAEMNELDVKEFEQYYPGLDEIDFLYIGNYVTDPDLNIKPYQALMGILHKGWDMVVMDSFVEVQSMIQEDLSLPSKKAEKWMLDLMKRHNSGHNKENTFTTFLCIQQMNKGGTYVGSKRLEHMTSAFLTLCWDKKEKGKRYMMFEKNRKGKEKIKLYYTFDKNKGIIYDDVRYEKEMMIFERLQSPSEFGVEEFDLNSFEKLFSETEE